MTKSEINNIHKSILKSVYVGKLYDACSLIRLQSVNSQTVNISSLSLIEDTYKLMLKYSVAGMVDPNRDKIFHQLQVSLLMMADSVRNSQFKKFQPSEIFTTYDYPVPSDIPNDENIVDWFNYILHNESFSTDLFSKFSKLSVSDKLSWINFCLLVSSLTLSSLLFFDINKFKLLVTYYLQNIDQIWQRSLVGIFVISYFFNKRLNLYPEIPELFAKIIDSKDFTERYHNIVIQFIKAINTDKISKKINEEILPQVTKIAPGIKDKMISDSTNLDNSDDTNPDWDNYFEDNPELLDKMAEVSKLQMEGSDVFINTFAMLKNFPFFHRLENWFLPYFPENKELLKMSEQFSDKTFNFKTFTDRLHKAPFICNSDKYSFCLSVGLMPESQRSSLGNVYNSQLGEMDDINREDELLHKAELSYKALTQYVQDLYRFFKLNRQGKEFVDIFDKSFSPIGTQLFDKTLNSSTEKRKIAEYFFANEYFKQAYDIFSVISIDDPNFQVFQKMGFAAQKLGDNQLALDNFLKAQLFDDKQLWNLKKIGLCYRKLKNPDKALEYYRIAESLEPDNLSIATSIGRCLLETENYSDALKYYFKVEYLEPKNVKIYRPIAWCSYELQKFDQALKYCLKIAESDRSPEDYVLAGHILMKQNKMSEAFDFYIKALSFNDYSVSDLEAAIKNDYFSENSDANSLQTNMILDCLLYKRDGKIDLL